MSTLHPWHQVSPGDNTPEIVNAIIEIPKGSKAKYEIDKDSGLLKLDRVLFSSVMYPANYGFIPQTLDEDVDELDALIITNEPLPTGVFLEARIIGVMKFNDDGEVDDKVVVVPADDRHTGNTYTSLNDLPKQLLDQIEFHFNHYKDLKKPGTTTVTGWGDVEEAKHVIHEAIERWNNR